MRRLCVLTLAVIAMIGFATAASATTTSGSAPTKHQNYGQLGTRWWKWALSIPYAHNPILDATGADCALGQNGGTWFLAGHLGEPVTRSCTVPAGKKILIPIVNYNNDYPCPDASFHPARHQSLKDFLTNGTDSIPGAVAIIDTATDLRASLDGRDIPITSADRGTSNLYSFAGDESLQALDPCITGSQQKAVSDGDWLLLAPLSPGQHTLRFGASFAGTIEDVTYHLTVS